MDTGSYAKIQSMDIATKVLVIVFVVLLVYLVSFLFLTPLLFPMSGASSMQDMMGHMMSFNAETTNWNLLALTLAVGAGLIATLLLRKSSFPQATQPLPSVQPQQKEMDELKIIRKILSDDEKALVDEIRRAGKITQDSLRFRLGWSKAKVSRILTNLDKMNLIQRERVGKTYNVFLTEKKKRLTETV